MESAGTPAPVPIGSEPVEPKPKRSLLKWSLIASAFLFAYFLWQCSSGMYVAAHQSDSAVQRFHSQLDAGAFENILRESDEDFQNSDSKEALLKFLAGVHSKLGKSSEISRTNIFVNSGTGGTTIKVT
jgi:hypothetical protein